MHGGGSAKNGGAGGPSAPDAISSRQPSGCHGHLWPSSQGKIAHHDTGRSPRTRDGGHWHPVQPEGCHGDLVLGALGPPAPPFSVKPPRPPCLRGESTGASTRRDAESFPSQGRDDCTASRGSMFSSSLPEHRQFCAHGDEPEAPMMSSSELVLMVGLRPPTAQFNVQRHPPVTNLVPVECLACSLPASRRCRSGGAGHSLRRPPRSGRTGPFEGFDADQGSTVSCVHG
jgi:hypothetical protein